VSNTETSRQISFRALCNLCRHNAANHQEYGRLCPHPTRCLAPGVDGAKRKAECPVWARLQRTDLCRKLERERDEAREVLTGLVRAVAAYGSSGDEFGAAMYAAEKLTGPKGYKQ
jgi:hypothetical protein